MNSKKTLPLLVSITYIKVNNNDYSIGNIENGTNLQNIFLPLDHYNNSSNYIIKDLNGLSPADSKFKIIKFPQKLLFHINDPADFLEFTVFRTKDFASIQLEEKIKLRNILKLSDFELIFQGKIDCCNFMNKYWKDDFYGIRMEREVEREKNEKNNFNIEFSKLEAIFLFAKIKFYFNLPLNVKLPEEPKKSDFLPKEKRDIHRGLLILKIKSFNKINENEKFIVGHNFQFEEIQKNKQRINQMEKYHTIIGKSCKETKIQLKRIRCRFDENLFVDLREGGKENLFFYHNLLLWKTIADDSLNQNFIKYLNYMDIKSFPNLLDFTQLEIHENEMAQISLEIRSFIL